MKFAVYIFVGWNALFLSAMGPLIGLIFLAVIAGGGATDKPLHEYEKVHGDGLNQLLSIKLSGVILGDSSDTGSPFGAFEGVTFGYDIKDKLYGAAKDSTVKGVILEINSPGGTIYGSRAIADGVKYYKEQTKNPVYAFISGVGASGAYWAAVSTDKIIADPGSDVGSIGVIMGPFKYYNKPLSETGGLLDGGVVTQNGIESVTLTAGKSKDVGNPYRKLTSEEIATLQREVNNDYDDFVAYVAQRRRIADTSIRTEIGAMAYGTKTALQLKLIDAASSREDAYDQLAQAAKVEKDYQVIREKSPVSFISSLLGVFTHQPIRQASAASPEPSLCKLSGSKLAYFGSVATLCP